MAETLKSCPLCGSTDLKHYVTNARNRNRGVIVCKECGLRLEAYSDSEYKVAQAYQGDFESAHEFTWEQARAAVADKWNRRAERTCHAIEFVEEETFGLAVYSECSECHETLGISSEYGSYLPRYCPHYGARVVGVTD